MLAMTRSSTAHKYTVNWEISYLIPSLLSGNPLLSMIDLTKINDNYHQLITQAMIERDWTREKEKNEE